jgi:hypothetical protein
MKAALRDTLIISDLHAPYQHPDAVDFLCDVARRYKTTSVVCIGDEIDAHTVSRYASDPDLARAAGGTAEGDQGSTAAVSCLPESVGLHEQPHIPGLPEGVRGRHSLRVPSRDQRSAEAPEGWQWKELWEIANVSYSHGEGFSGRTPALAACERMRANAVIGHVHTAAGVSWSYARSGALFGLSVGCLINPKAAAFAYAKHEARRPALGCGVIKDGIPMFVPLR